jgi:hypothetical protein
MFPKNGRGCCARTGWAGQAHIKLCLAIPKIGTEEFVVYNKQDEHIMLSHTSWILIFTPEQMQTTQGWYEVHDAPSPHWKYFWFD